MTRPPRRPTEPLLSGDVIARIVLVSVLLLGAAFALFEHELSRGTTDAEARTVAANVFVFVEIGYVFNCRSFTGRAIELGLFSNRWLVGGVSLTVALQLLFTYWSPMNDLFQTAPIGVGAWIKIIGVALLAWIIVEVEKTIRRHAANRPGHAAVAAASD